MDTGYDVPITEYPYAAEGGIIGYNGGGFTGSPHTEGPFYTGEDEGSSMPEGMKEELLKYLLQKFMQEQQGKRPPFDPNAPIEVARGGVMDLQGGGYNPLRQSNPRFITRAHGGSTAGDLADRLEENPGVAQFFPRRFGEISGPGGPKEDKIPAMLSDGEFVMTAKAVDNAGGPKSMYNLMNRLDPESSRGRGIV